MVSHILLNGTRIKVNEYKEEIENGAHKVTVVFNVTSEEYHDITTLLYEGTFDVNIPERELMFRGTIREYATSFTNLYIKGQVGVFTLTLLEMK